MKTALICGVSGQDGAYLSKFLLERGYKVVGTSRDAQTNGFGNLKRLNVYDEVEKVSMTSTDFRSVLQVISTFEPDEIYNLAGQTSVGLSFTMPVETYDSITVGVLNLLEAVRFSGLQARLYNAGSGECFGDTDGLPASENWAFRPRSPYATAKAAAHWTVANYREAYGVHACTGILFNHESPLRPKRFVTRKIISAACAIASGERSKLILGNLEVHRDWGWAPEYVEAMWLMLQRDSPDDFVIATGKSTSLRNFCEIAFRMLGLDVYDHLEVNETFLRPLDISANCGSAAKAEEQLGWRAEVDIDCLVAKLIRAEQTGLVLDI